jgi:hypothetical protein
MPQRQAYWSQLATDQFDDLLDDLRRRNPAVARRVGRAIFAKVDQIEWLVNRLSHQYKLFKSHTATLIPSRRI